MTVKQFLKSKVFRCIIVLMCIALVSGALLSVCNDLLKVSDEERVLRTIKKIYGSEIGYEEIEVSYETDTGRIDNIYKLADGNYLVKSTGYNGYQQGTISVWLVAKYDNGEYAGIDDVGVADNEKQTLMSKFTAGVLSEYEGKGEEDFNVIVGGATYSSHALNNAVNVAAKYFLGQTEETGGNGYEG